MKSRTKNNGLRKIHTIEFTKNHRHFTIKAESIMDDCTYNVPKLSVETTEWTSRGRRSGTVDRLEYLPVLMDDGTYSYETGDTTEAQSRQFGLIENQALTFCKMTQEEINSALILRMELVSEFSKQFYG